jgi:hypothetical protein
MKYLFTFFIALMGWNASAQQSITPEAAHIVIDGSTSREQLADIHRQLYAQGIKMTYNPNFGPERQLFGLTFTITSGDGLINGEGSHSKLNYQNAKVILDINMSTKQVDIQYEGQQ